MNAYMGSYAYQVGNVNYLGSYLVLGRSFSEAEGELRRWVTKQFPEASQGQLTVGCVLLGNVTLQAPDNKRYDVTFGIQEHTP